MGGHEGLLGGVVGGREERGAVEAAGVIHKNFYIIFPVRLMNMHTDKRYEIQPGPLILTSPAAAAAVKVKCATAT